MFCGSLVPIVTPFQQGGIDRDALGRVIEHVLAGGSNGLVPCGTTGESATLSHEEHDRIVGWTIEIAAGRVPVIAGTGSNSTEEAIRLTRCARDAGADGALLISPYYNKPTQEGIYRHYRAVAEAAHPLPILLYNVPSRTSSRIEPETIARLAEIENVVGVKDATGSLELTQRTIELCGDRIGVFSGEDALNFPILAVGGAGVISATANVAPKLLADVARFAAAGRWEEARRAHYELLPIARACFLETNPIPVKTACEILGICSAELRLPLTPMQPESRAALERALRDAGLLAARAGGAAA